MPKSYFSLANNSGCERTDNLKLILLLLKITENFYLILSEIPITFCIHADATANAEVMQYILIHRLSVRL